GTWSVYIDPYQTDTGSITTTLYAVPPDASKPITAGGAAVSIATTIPGQNAKPTVSGTTGKPTSVGTRSITFQYANASVSIRLPNESVTLRILRPNLTSLYNYGYLANLHSFPTRRSSDLGTWSVYIDPYQTDTGSITTTLYAVPPDASKPITAGGAAVSIAT